MSVTFKNNRDTEKKTSASQEQLLEKYQRQYSFSNEVQALPQVDENDDSTFGCIHPSSPCRNLHNVPISDWSSGCLDEDNTIATEEGATMLSPAARARERQLALQQQQQQQQQKKKKNKRLALLVLDLQNDFLDESGLLGTSDMTLERTNLLTRIRDLTQQTLQLGGVVYFIQSLYFNREGCCIMGTSGSEWHPEAVAMMELLSRHSRVHFMTKQWYSAFLETTLHAQLQQQDVSSVLVAGVSTPQSVAATVRSASHLGYITTLADATAQQDAKQQPATYFSLAPFCHGVLAPSAPVQGSNYPIVDTEVCLRSAKDSDEEKKDDDKPKRAERLVFDGCVRLSGIGAGDSMLLPEVFEADKADALLKVIVKVVGEKQKVHYEWTGDKTSTWTAIFRPVQNHVEKLTKQGMDWGRIVLVKPTEGQEEKSVATNASSSTEGTRNLRSQKKGDFSSVPMHQSSMNTTDTSMRDVYNQCYLPSDKITRRANYVAVIALGEGRIIEFVPKDPEEAKYAPQHIYCHHNSLLLIGPRTLQNYNHNIKTRNRNHPSPRVCITLGSLSRPQTPVPASIPVATPVKNTVATKEASILAPEVVPLDFSTILRHHYLHKVISLVFFFGFLLGYFRATLLSETTCIATT